MREREKGSRGGGAREDAWSRCAKLWAQLHAVHLKCD
jgi:hypothetical protein